MVCFKADITLPLIPEIKRNYLSYRAFASFKILYLYKHFWNKMLPAFYNDNRLSILIKCPEQSFTRRHFSLFKF